MMKKEIPCRVCSGRGYVNRGTENLTGNETCKACRGSGKETVPLTMYDRIQAMNESELAEFIAKEIIGIKAPGKLLIAVPAWLGWLRHPVEETT